MKSRPFYSNLPSDREGPSSGPSNDLRRSADGRYGGRVTTAGLLLALVASVSCAHYGGTPIDFQQTASSMIDQREAEGLYVAVRNFSLPTDSNKYFGRDLLDAGYVPVLVLLELDRSSQAIFDVRREDLRLCLQDGTRLASADPRKVCEDVAFSHSRSAMGFLLLLPGFFVASSVNRANEQMESDYRGKALKSVRINPNRRSFQGVVFFELPDSLRDDFSVEEAFVEAKVYLGGGDGTVGRVLEFPVHFGD